MTYCLGVLVNEGVVLASDSRTNAGVDHISTVCKMATFEVAGDRHLTLLSAGNLATTQSVVSELRQATRSGDHVRDLFAAASIYDAARMVGETLRDVMQRDAAAVRPYGSPDGTFLLGGQIGDGATRLFQIYSAGNFVETAGRSQFLQLGEVKYGRPILDRTMRWDMSLREAAMIALLSFDATMRSNLSVAPPIDLLCYGHGSLETTLRRTYSDDDPYFQSLREQYGSGMLDLVGKLPAPEA